MSFFQGSTRKFHSEQKHVVPFFKFIHGFPLFPSLYFVFIVLSHQEIPIADDEDAWEDESSSDGSEDSSDDGTKTSNEKEGEKKENETKKTEHGEKIEPSEESKPEENPKTSLPASNASGEGGAADAAVNHDPKATGDTKTNSGGPVLSIFWQPPHRQC